ncbi:1,4-alpha-glucan branching protein domain-containing protein, partial [Pseudonocardia sp.]|uniref:1,4-alpha-glucan branching protein domain-containing protein n=1 Tax=Pseudonocardia sp. TaxID=60912 RepID=UPI0031FCD704
EALLALSSDWAFMVSKDSAAGYARDRAHGHAGRVEELARLLAADRRPAAARRVASCPPAPFGHVDARTL